MITTKQLAKELNISQRAIQNRILRLGLKVQRAGVAFVLSHKQAEAVRNYSVRYWFSLDLARDRIKF